MDRQKIIRAKAKAKKESQELALKRHQESIESTESLKGEISNLYELLNGHEPYDFEKLEKQMETLAENLDLSKFFEDLNKSIKDSKVEIDNAALHEILEAVKNNKPLPINVELTLVEELLQKVVEKLEEETEPASQEAKDYIPTRRVIQVGRRFIFDDTMGTSAGGGGGSSVQSSLTRNDGTSVAVTNPDGTNIGGGSGGGLTNTELRATPVPVSMSSDIEIGAVELKNGTDDTRATITAANALKIDGSAVTQPISGTVAISNPTTNPETGLAKDTSLGSLTEAAPATDTASSGLNGRLQRIAQRLTSIIALLPGSLGQKARNASLAVTLSTEDVSALTPPAAITGYSTANNQTDGSQKTQLIDSGGQAAEVNTRTDGIVALEVNDDFTSFEANHQTLVASTDTTITFAQTVRMIQIQNWHISARLLVKDAAITSDSDSASARVGIAPAANVPGKGTFIFKTSSIHVRSGSTNEITVIGYF